MPKAWRRTSAAPKGVIGDTPPLPISAVFSEGSFKLQIKFDKDLSPEPNNPATGDIDLQFGLFRYEANPGSAVTYPNSDTAEIICQFNGAGVGDTLDYLRLTELLLGETGLPVAAFSGFPVTVP